MWRQPPNRAVANPLYPGEAIERAKGPASCTILDDAGRQGGTDPRQSLDGRRVGHVNIDEYGLP